jgi:hypothetical protein
MKFLVCAWPAEDRPSALPSADAFQAQTQWFRSRLAAGVIDCAHHADNRAVFIFNAESVAALEALIAEIPLSGAIARSIEPLADFRTHAERVTAYLRDHARDGS